MFWEDGYMCLKADCKTHKYATMENGKVVCKDCHENCKECIGPNINQCSSCYDSDFLRDKVCNNCIDDAENFFVKDDADGQ